MSFLEILALIAAGAITLATILGIFLAINAYLIRKERERYTEARREKPEPKF